MHCDKGQTLTRTRGSRGQRGPGALTDRRFAVTNLTSMSRRRAIKTRTWWPHTKRMVWFLVALGGLMATPMEVLARDPFDINALSVDEENRFSNVGAFIVGVVNGSGNPVACRAHCSGVLTDVAWRHAREERAYPRSTASGPAYAMASGATNAVARKH